MRKRIRYALLAFFSALIVAGCADVMQDVFAPGLRAATEQLTSDVADVAAQQGEAARIIADGQAALRAKIDAAVASVDAVAFDSDEARTAAAVKFSSLHEALAVLALASTDSNAELGDRITSLFADAEGVADDVAAAPGAALSVFGNMLSPILGPYAPLADIALGILGIGGTARWTGKRGQKHGATSVLAPIEKARERALEAQLTEADPAGRKFIVFDTLRTKPVFDTNGVAAIINSFRGLAEKAA